VADAVDCGSDAEAAIDVEPWGNIFVRMESKRPISKFSWVAWGRSRSLNWIGATGLQPCSATCRRKRLPSGSALDAGLLSSMQIIPRISFAEAPPADYSSVHVAVRACLPILGNLETPMAGESTNECMSMRSWASRAGRAPEWARARYSLSVPFFASRKCARGPTLTLASQASGSSRPTRSITWWTDLFRRMNIVRWHRSTRSSRRWPGSELSRRQENDRRGTASECATRRFYLQLFYSIDRSNLHRQQKQDHRERGRPTASELLCRHNHTSGGKSTSAIAETRNVPIFVRGTIMVPAQACPLLVGEPCACARALSSDEGTIRPKKMCQKPKHGKLKI